MNHNYLLSVLLIQSFLGIPSAEPYENESFFNIPLKDLINVPVSVASKKKEMIADAPGVISVITADEIRRFGGRNLRDILNRATSFQSVASEFAPGMAVFLRGQSLFQFDNHVLYLINGHPFRDSDTGGSNSPLLLGLPVDMIKRLEIIRGPGSVLYGSNAFAGIVNIVTKSASEFKTLELSGSYGSFDARSANVVMAGAEDNWEILVAARGLELGGWPFRFSQPSGAGSVTTEFDREQDMKSAFATVRHKNLSLNAFYGAHEESSFAFSENVLTMDRWLVVTEYSHDINDRWQALGSITHNGARLKTPEVTETSTNDVHAELTLKGQINDRFNVIFGTVSEFHSGDLNGADFDAQWYSAYHQSDYQIFDWLKVIGGLQWNKAAGVKENFSPRFSAIFDVNKEWSLKLGYGEAFRAAFSGQRFFENSFIVGDPKLKPEIIETLEAQVFYQSSRSFLGLTFFHSEISDIITFVPNSGPSIFRWGNSGEITSKGVELEGKANLTKNIQVLGSVTYQTNENQDGIDDVTFTPNWMAKLGVSYDCGAGYSIGIFDAYFGNPTQVKNVNPGATELNPTPESYHSLTVNINLHIPTFFDKPAWPDTTLSLFGDNLLDEDIHFPDFNSRTTRSIPQHSGRAIYTTFKVKF